MLKKFKVYWKDSRTRCRRMKQVLVRLPNERPECNDIKPGDCLRLLRTHRGRTIARKATSPCDYVLFAKEKEPLRRTR